jgi:hypothetical protein
MSQFKWAMLGRGGDGQLFTLQGEINSSMDFWDAITKAWEEAFGELAIGNGPYTVKEFRMWRPV